MPVPAWLVAIGSWLAQHFWQIYKIALGLLGLYYAWQFGGAIISGVQQATPGVGQMVAGIGMIFTLLPPIIMMMMMMWILSTFMQLFQ